MIKSECRKGTTIVSLSMNKDRTLCFIGGERSLNVMKFTN